MMGEGKFSLLISVYKNDISDHLDTALTSIWTNQTLKPNQIVLVIDGPVSESVLDVIKKWESQLLHVIDVLRFTENQGLALAMRSGLAKCKYELVARMDADDISYPDRFYKQVGAFLKRDDISVFGGSVQEFNHVPNDLNRFRKLPADYSDLFKFAKYRNPLNHPTVMFRKSHVLSVGSYEHMPLFEDYFLWIKLLNKGYRLENTTQPLLHFRVGNDMVGRRHGLSYLQKEWHFLHAVNMLGFLSKKELTYSFVLKLPLRLLPKKVLSLIYKRLLR